MPMTLAILYHLRKILFTGLVLLMTAVIWLLMADLIIRYPIGAFMLKYLSIWYGFWPMTEHGIRGAMGVYPETLEAHWMITLWGLGVFFMTQFLFLEPGRHWHRHLIHRTPAQSYVYVMAAFPIALLTVSVMTSMVQLAGLWEFLPGEAYHSMGCIWFPQTMVLWITVLVAWTAWSLILQSSFRRGDRYMQLAGMTYCIFIGAAICLGISAVVQIHVVGFTSQYYLSGSYTGMMLSGSVMLWTLIPALMLIYAGKDYSEHRIELIIDGDNMGKHWFNVPKVAANTI
ncbi:MAG TPA: hypothetical protein DCM28_18755 [Phycisphaerales bacterium]|nr:hypothetical protein [Phycisphaerales bacterium]